MKNFLFGAFTLLGFYNAFAQNNYPLTYPKTRKGDQVDNYFGTKVSDPYRWMEDENATEVKDWVEAEKQVTQAYLGQIPFREKIKNRITEIINYPKYTAPARVGEYYIFSKNDGLQNQPVEYIQKGLDGTPVVLIDPNKMSSDGTAALTLDGSSKDNKYMIYTVAQSGSDWQDIGVIDLATQTILKDKISWVKFPQPTWYGNGFFYSGYKQPQKGKELSVQNDFQKIYYHKIGESQDKDALIYEDKEHPLRYVGAQVTEDEQFLLIYIRDVGQDGGEVMCKNLKKGDTNFKMLFKGFEYDYGVINTLGEKLIVNTNNNAPNNKIILVDPAQPDDETGK